jgi:RNA polymerase sigma-70 factor (ECF subfamily)
MKNEDELVDKALSGSQSSFESLLYPYRNGMLSLAYRMTGDEQEAREVCQEAMMKIFKYLGKFKRGKSLKNWMYSIVTHSACDHLRGRKKHTKLHDGHYPAYTDEENSPEDQFLRQEIKERLKECLERLAPKERIVFLLRDVEGFSVEETAEVVGGSSVSIRVHLSRARKKIRDQFETFYSSKEVRG